MSFSSTGQRRSEPVCYRSLFQGAPCVSRLDSSRSALPRISQVPHPPLHVGKSLPTRSPRPSLYILARLRRLARLIPFFMSLRRHLPRVLDPPCFGRLALCFSASSLALRSPRAFASTFKKIQYKSCGLSQAKPGRAQHSGQKKGLGRGKPSRSTAKSQSTQLFGSAVTLKELTTRLTTMTRAELSS